MDEDAVLLALGNLQGEIRGYNTRMDGIGREIREIKDSLKCKNEDCISCRKELDAQDTEISKKVSVIESTHTGEKAVSSWMDSSITKWCVIIGAGCGIIGVIYLFVTHGG